MTGNRSYIRASLLLSSLCLWAHIAAGTNYYINSNAGNDNSAGTSRNTPWQSLKNLGSGRFLPGDSFFFAKGSAYTGGFVFRCSGAPGKPIVFTSYSADAGLVLSTPRQNLEAPLVRYGAGQKPAFSNPRWDTLNGNIFRIEASYVIIDGLYFHDNTNPPGSNRKNKNVQKMGAVYLAAGSDHNIVRNCEFFNSPVGIKVKGSHNLITRNYLHDRYERITRSWGPIAIMIVAPYNEISWNTVTNYGSYGGAYGSDGGVIELDGVDDAFDGRNIHIHHNVSVNNHGFLELAGRNVDSITVAYNLSDDKNQFIGGGSMKNVLVCNNTVIRTREPNVDRYVFWTFAPEATFMTVRNNIFVIPPDMQVFGPVKKQAGHHRTGVGEQERSHNLYFSPGNPDPVGIAKAKSDIIADPLFADPLNRNFRLTEKSPAKDRGVRMGYAFDLDQYPVSPGNVPDLGAYEF
ncbi:MAG TPA: hypothetical protein VD772_03985 [Anseongella sp.]|nr:hypothetical protein [Anseongella sp.]